jgi:hypothetical protein
MGREARANQSAAEEIAPFVFSVPFAKVDKEKRLVSGVATAENLDKQGEIVDYETAKKFFTNDALWPGNIREMHKAEAVGTAVDVECDDANKVISITARISKGAPNTWEKVQDGTLKMFSIGGSGKRVAEKVDGKMAKRLFLEQLAEVSLVDNGANPLAKFDIVKSVDGAVVRVDDDPTPAAEIVNPVEKATAAVDAVLEDVTKAKAADDGEKNKTASGKTGKDYAGTDGKSFPIEEPVDITNAVRDLGRTSQDKAKVKANIIRIAYKLGDKFVAKLPDEWKKKSDQKDAEKAVRYSDISADDIVSLVVLDRDGTVAKGGPEPYDIDSALSAISFVNRLMANEYWEARHQMAGASDDQKQQIAMLKTACDALLEFLQAEYEEQFSPDAGTAGAPPPLDLSDVIDMDDAVEMFTSALTVIKAGARHSAKDRDLVQKVHDASTALGATCPPAEDDEAEKVAKAAAAKTAACKTCKGVGKIRDGHMACPDCSGVAAKAVTPAPDAEPIQKLTAELDATKALLAESQATVAKQAETVATFEARLKTLEDAPAGGGPVRNAQAAEKSLGGPAATAEEGSPEAAIKVLTELAETSGDDVVRQAAFRKIFSIQTATGANRMGFAPPK